MPLQQLQQPSPSPFAHYLHHRLVLNSFFFHPLKTTHPQPTLSITHESFHHVLLSLSPTWFRLARYVFVFRTLPFASSLRGWMGTSLACRAPLRRPSSHRFRQSRRRCRPEQEIPHRGSVRRSVASLGLCKVAQNEPLEDRLHRRRGVPQPPNPRNCRSCHRLPGPTLQGSNPSHVPCCSRRLVFRFSFFFCIIQTNLFYLSQSVGRFGA